MNSFYHSGEGQALVVRKKCNNFIYYLKQFKSTLIVTNTDDIYSKILQYENSIFGNKLLAGTVTTSPFPINFIASDGLLNFRLIPFILDGKNGIIIYITGVYKKNRNYCSREIQYIIPPPVIAADKNVKSIDNYFSSIAIKDNEVNKLLDSDPILKQLFQKLKK